MFQNFQKLNLNRGISAPIAILVIVAFAVMCGALALWQYSEIEKETSNFPETQSNKEDISMSGWETFRSEEHGFEIKYPSDRLPQSNFVYNHPDGSEDKNAVRFWQSGIQDMYVYFCLLDGNYKDEGVSMKAAISEIIGGHKALTSKFDMKGGGRKLYFLEKDKNSTLMIDTFWTYDENFSYDKKEKIFNQMLSTFKFIENI